MHPSTSSCAPCGVTVLGVSLGVMGVVHACAFMIVNWAHFLALPLTRFPHLQAYLKRVSERPRVQDALRAEGLLK
jgi:glutathione S-transferase